MRHDLRFTQVLRAELPVPPSSYYQRIDDTIAFLKKVDEASKKRERHNKNNGGMLRNIRAVMAYCAIVLFFCAGTFAIKPALAAELPLIGDAVYALAPTISARAEKLDEITGLVNTAVSAFAMGDYAVADMLFYNGKSWTADEDTYSTAKYLYYTLHNIEVFAGDETKAEAMSFSITDAVAEQKAFRYEVIIFLELKDKDGNVRQERMHVRLIETISGIYLSSVRTESEGYDEYVAQCLLYGLEGVKYGNPTGGIVFEAGYLSFMAVHKDTTLSLEEKQRLLDRLYVRLIEAGLSEQEQKSIFNAMEDEKVGLYEQHTPAVVAAEKLAAEVMYRYYLGRKLQELQNFSDIVERNEDTDLFFYDAQLLVSLTLEERFSVLDTVEKGTAEILEIIKSNDERMIASFHVYTHITAGPMKGVGEQVILTLEKREDGWIVIGYDRMGSDGIYANRLKPLAQQYKKQGMSWQEANKNAYQDLLSAIGS